MSYRRPVHWVATGLFAAAMAASGVLYRTRTPALTAAFDHLGYPPYFQTILGAAKLAGAVALLLPGLPLVKEWAYAGFAFTLAGAALSHLASGDGPETLFPLVAAVVLATSYLTRPLATEEAGGEMQKESMLASRSNRTSRTQE